MTTMTTACEHDWPLEDAAWKDALYNRNWPLCKKCGGIDLLQFIDVTDRVKECRTQDDEFKRIMEGRHLNLFNGHLIPRAKATPGIANWWDKPRPHAGWDKPLSYFVTLRDPQAALSGPTLGRGFDRPFLRMIGWKLWWEGGTIAMKQHFKAGFSLDYIWHNVGLGSDVWMA